MKTVKCLFEDIKHTYWQRIYYRVYWKWENIRYFFKRQYQRWKYGFALEESWNLFDYTCKYILPRLKYMREHGQAHPCEMTFEEWHDILDKIIWSCEHWDDNIEPIYSEDYIHGYEVVEEGDITRYIPLNKTGTIDLTPRQEHQTKVQLGFDLLGKHFLNLWD